MKKNTTVLKADKKKTEAAKEAAFFMGDEKVVKPYQVRDAHIARGGSYTIVDGKAILNETNGAKA